MNLRIVLALTLFVTICNGYKVLFLAPMNGKSHFLYLQNFVHALLKRGHEVTFLTSNSLSHLKLANYTEVLIDPPIDLTSQMDFDGFLKGSSAPAFPAAIFGINMLKNFPRMMNPYAFENPNVQKFIHSTGLHFDVVISEEFFADSFLMFAHQFQAPIITICPFGSPDWFDRQTGLLTPYSHVPHWTLPFLDDMTFLERNMNFIVSAYDWAVRTFAYLPTEEEYTRKYFGHLGPLPSLNDILRNVSLSLVNQHRALAPPRPAMPSIINIGGAHIKPAKPLPKDLQTFLDEAKDGVIYFSLGTVVQSSKLPKDKLKAFLDSFKTLKQRVLWKFEDESLADIPSNVMVRKWMPQNDILAHPNVILFISHGGQFGTSESLYHGVPLLLIPFFGDQKRNAYRIKRAGYGEYISFNDLTTESFTKVLNELTSDKSYLAKAKETSAIFRDNLVHPMDEAMFWIEHVCKFKGAKHLKSHAVNMSWFTYLLLDVIIVDSVAVLAIGFIFYYLLKKLFSIKKTSQIAGKKQN